METAAVAITAALEQVGTRIPHWFGSTGDESAEVLSVFGPQGERMHTRARPAQTRTSANPPA